MGQLLTNSDQLPKRVVKLKFLESWPILPPKFDGGCALKGGPVGLVWFLHMLEGGPNWLAKFYYKMLVKKSNWLTENQWSIALYTIPSYSCLVSMDINKMHGWQQWWVLIQRVQAWPEILPLEIILNIQNMTITYNMKFNNKKCGDKDLVFGKQFLDRDSGGFYIDVNKSVVRLKKVWSVSDDESTDHCGTTSIHEPDFVALPMTPNNETDRSSDDGDSIWQEVEFLKPTKRSSKQVLTFVDAYNHHCLAGNVLEPLTGSVNQTQGWWREGFPEIGLKGGIGGVRWKVTS